MYALAQRVQHTVVSCYFYGLLPYVQTTAASRLRLLSVFGRSKENKTGEVCVAVQKGYFIHVRLGQSATGAAASAHRIGFS